MRDQAESARADSAGCDKVRVPRDSAGQRQEQGMAICPDRAARRRKVLLERLRAQGLKPPAFGSFAWESARPGAGRYCAVTAGGASLRVSTGPLWQDAVHGNAGILSVLTERAGRRLEAGLPLSFWFCDFGGSSDASVLLQQVCERLRQSLLVHGSLAGRTATVIHSHAVPQRGHELIACEALGAAQRYVFLDNLQLHDQSSAAVRQRTNANWKLLRSCAGMGRPLLPVYGGIVKSACPLLGDEKACAVLVPAGLLCPADSAWLPVEVPLRNFLLHNGALDWPRLVAALDLAVLAGDELIDHVPWIEAALVTDATVNRRLAIRVTGMGDVVASRDENPADLDCLRRLDRDVQRIRTTLHDATRRLARLKGPLPALRQLEPVDDWPNGPQRETWQRCWRTALARTAVRNRSLLVMSPYDVLPKRNAADSRFADLLPVIRHADAWCFAGQPRFAGWDASAYRRFHRRARATIQGDSAQSLIAAGV